VTDLLWIELVCFLVVMAATFAALKWVEREVRRLTKMQDDVNDSMMKARKADGKKLRQLTGEEHGPLFLLDDEINGLAEGTHYLDANGDVQIKPIK